VFVGYVSKETVDVVFLEVCGIIPDRFFRSSTSLTKFILSLSEHGSGYSSAVSIRLRSERFDPVECGGITFE
jgi:hypothetical protein